MVRKTKKKTTSVRNFNEERVLFLLLLLIASIFFDFYLLYKNQNVSAKLITIKTNNANLIAGSGPQPTIPPKATKRGSDGTWCYDSNIGNPYLTKGYCQDNSGTHTNYCDSATVRDYYCGGTWDGKTWKQVKCQAGGYACSSRGLQCKNGVCLK